MPREQIAHVGQLSTKLLLSVSLDNCIWRTILKYVLEEVTIAKHGAVIRRYLIFHMSLRPQLKDIVNSHHCDITKEENLTTLNLHNTTKLI
jgi:hypothetical protein